MKKLLLILLATSAFAQESTVGNIDNLISIEQVGDAYKVIYIDDQFKNINRASGFILNNSEALEELHSAMLREVNDHSLDNYIMPIFKGELVISGEDGMVRIFHKKSGVMRHSIPLDINQVNKLFGK